MEQMLIRHEICYFESVTPYIHWNKYKPVLRHMPAYVTISRFFSKRKWEFILNVHNWMWKGNTIYSATKSIHLLLPLWVHKFSVSNLLPPTDSDHIGYSEILYKTAKDHDFDWQHEIKKLLNYIHSRREASKSHMQSKAMSPSVPRGTPCSSEASWSANKSLNCLDSKFPFLN